MHKVVVTRLIPEAGLKLLNNRSDIEVVLNPADRPMARAELLAALPGASAVLSLLTDRMDSEAMEAAGVQLKIVSNYAVGYDNIDLNAAANRKVLVTNTPEVLTDAVAEHTVAMMCAVCRRIAEGDRLLRSGRYGGWDPLLLLGLEFKGKTLGIIGTGRIGSGVARRAALGFGMKIVYSDMKPNEALEAELGARPLPLEQLLSEADVVSIHVPLLPSTRHLLNAEKLAIMKPTSYLINTSRGPVIDEVALTDVLRRKAIAGAALDVFENEPALAPGLAEMENAVLTPHIASATYEARSAMAVLAAQAILDALDGTEPKNLVKA